MDLEHRLGGVKMNFFKWLTKGLYRAFIQGIYADDCGNRIKDRTFQLLLWALLITFLGIFISLYISAIGIMLLIIGLCYEVYSTADAQEKRDLFQKICRDCLSNNPDARCEHYIERVIGNCKWRFPKIKGL